MNDITNLNVYNFVSLNFNIHSIQVKIITVSSYTSDIFRKSTFMTDKETF